jgi:hypothetical protein
VSTTATRPKSRFDSIIRRFVLALALVPIVPATSLIGTITTEILVTPPAGAFDHVWWFHVFFTALWMAGFLLVWRTAIIWTLGRSALTTLVSFIPFVQIVFNKPLWNTNTSGCINLNETFLRAGQHYTSCGLWTWLVVWVWWGLEKKIMTSQKSKGREMHRRLPWLARLGASMGVFPVIFGIFIIVMVFLDTILRMPWAASSIFWVYLPCAIIVLIAWCLIWRKAVCWSDGVLGATCGMWLLLIGVPISLQFFSLGGTVTPFRDVLINCLPIIGWGVWMGWTMWYWPMRIDSADSAAQIPTCMKCGYSLQGLKATRCPECGDEPTIDELWASSCTGVP